MRTIERTVTASTQREQISFYINVPASKLMLLTLVGLAGSWPRVETGGAQLNSPMESTRLQRPTISETRDRKVCGIRHMPTYTFPQQSIRSFWSHLQMLGIGWAPIPNVPPFWVVLGPITNSGEPSASLDAIACSYMLFSF